MKEDCDTDLDWCFKNAVGNTLPETFFSYNSTPATSPSKAVSFARAISEMELPSMTEVLDRAGTRGSTDDSGNSGISTATADSAPAPSGYKAKRSSESIAKRSAYKHPHSHRFNEIHHRSKLSHTRSRWYKRDDSDSSSSSSAAPPSPTGLTSMEVSITKGYSDGFLTAKIFAQYGMSRLGFKGQYVTDSISALGPNTVAPGTEDYYTAWFYRGLADAESIVGSAVNA